VKETELKPNESHDKETLYWTLWITNANVAGKNITKILEMWGLEKVKDNWLGRLQVPQFDNY